MDKQRLERAIALIEQAVGILKELAAEPTPPLTTEEILDWIEKQMKTASNTDDLYHLLRGIDEIADRDDAPTERVEVVRKQLQNKLDWLLKLKTLAFLRQEIYRCAADELVSEKVQRLLKTKIALRKLTNELPDKRGDIDQLIEKIHQEIAELAHK